jgi:DNA phosphorothioation-associated putative methyltransferase
VADGILTPDRSFFDFGCGRGGDVRQLANQGFQAHGWDPVHRSDGHLVDSDVVNIGYVVNVIESASERIEAIMQAWSLSRSALIVAARPEWEAFEVKGSPKGDGIITSTGTFQKFFGQEELQDLIRVATGVEPIAAAPGIFYAFRNQTDAAGIRARRFRKRGPTFPRLRQADILWDAHRELLEPLATFWEDRGRLPASAELKEAADIESVLGSLRMAAGILKRVLGEERFELSRKSARADLQVFLALEAFGGRKRFSQLPDDVVLDVRAHFGTYKAACSESDRLLFSLADSDRVDEALRRSSFGKILPDAIYVHASYVELLDPLLRIYEGAARALLGNIEPVTLVKLSRIERRVSYLWYPTFEKEAHPELSTSLRVDLRNFDVKWRDFRSHRNPPILHRKEAFVPEIHASRRRFANLTRQEEKFGLLADSSHIGTKEGWAAVLNLSNVAIKGHRVTKRFPDD